MPKFEESRVVPIELRDVDDKRRQIAGVAAPYNTPTPVNGQYIEILAPGVFKKSISEAAKPLPLLAFHDSEKWPVGKALSWEETERGLLGVWQLTDDDEGRRAWDMCNGEFVSGLSVGFQPIRSDVDPGDETTPPTVTRREARLYETSLVATPAYAAAQITLVRTAGVRRNTPRLDAWRQWRDNLTPDV